MQAEENGGTVSGVTFSRLTLQQASPVMVSYTNVLPSAYSLIQVLLNGIPITVL